MKNKLFCLECEEIMEPQFNMKTKEYYWKCPRCNHKVKILNNDERGFADAITAKDE